MLTAMSAAPLMLVMTIMVTMVPVVPLLFFVMPFFMVFTGLFPFNIDPAIAFDIVGAACVDPDVYPWWCRHIAIDVHIHT